MNSVIDTASAPFPYEINCFAFLKEISSETFSLQSINVKREDFIFSYFSVAPCIFTSIYLPHSFSHFLVVPFLSLQSQKRTAVNRDIYVFFFSSEKENVVTEIEQIWKKQCTTHVHEEQQLSLLIVFSIFHSFFPPSFRALDAKHWNVQWLTKVFIRFFIQFMNIFKCCYTFKVRVSVCTELINRNKFSLET